MTARLDARIEVSRGEMVFGTVVVPMIPAGPAGGWRVGGPRGPILRPLRFGERTRLSAMAATSNEPCASLGAAIARAATVADGGTDEEVNGDAGGNPLGNIAPLVREAAALLLCGARNAGASFGETVLRVARATGWDLAQVIDADAAEIDRLAAALGAAPRETGWQRLVFAGASNDASLTALRDDLANALLARVEEVGGVVAAESLTFDSPETTARTRADLGPSQDNGGGSRGVAPGPGELAPKSVPAAVPAWQTPPGWPTEWPVARSGASAVIAPAAPMETAGEPRAQAAGPREQATGPRASVALIAPQPERREADHADRAPVSARFSSGRSVMPPRAEAAAAAAQPSSRGSMPARADRLGLGAVSTDGAASGTPTRASRLAPRWNSPLSSAAVGGLGLDLEGLAPDVGDALAALLDEESDLRGLE